MPQISDKGKSMPTSPIRKLVPYAEKAKERGIQIYHLNIGQPDIKTPKIALNAVQQAGIEVLAYSPSAGFQTYRDKLVSYYAKQNIHINSDDIITTTGGSEALLFAMGSITDPGDEVIIPEPFYANYNGFASANGVKVVPVISELESGFALPPISHFEKLISPKTKAIVICNPGNPTGYLYSKEEIEQLALLIKKNDLFLIADEVYREFSYDGHKHHSVMEQEDIDNHTIMIDSVSKRYSMCGARIGCLVSRNKDVIKTAMKFAQARLSPPTFAQIASEAALDTPETYFTQVIEEYVSRRNTLIAGLREIPGVQVATPKGAFYCIAALPIKNADAFAQWLLESFDWDGKTIMVAPAAGFYSTKGAGLNQVRIAYVLEEEALKEAVTILKVALETYQD